MISPEQARELEKWYELESPGEPEGTYTSPRKKTMLNYMLGAFKNHDTHREIRPHFYLRVQDTNVIFRSLLNAWLYLDLRPVENLNYVSAQHELAATLGIPDYAISIEFS